MNRSERVLSILVGSLLTYKAFSRKRQSLKATLGAYLIFRGATGYCPIRGAFQPKETTSFIEIVASLTVHKPLATTYRFWRNLSSLPLFMKHLKSITEVDKTKSTWVAALPWHMGKLQWEAEITAEREHEFLA